MLFSRWLRRRPRPTNNFRPLLLVLEDRNMPSGLGLGLYISRSIVDAHGGAIGVESKIGEGSCFRIAIPILARPA